MGSALGWGALAASSLVIGALLGLARRWPDRQIGLVLAFGAGALIMKDTEHGGVYAVRGTEPFAKKSWELKGF